MARRMLIDASHPEETRVVVVDGTRLEEFDFETATRKPLKGNIYLAKVIRIEPSLQAAFVEYGGNRHGFLAFSEIHPDYYQIPVADRERLIAEQQRLHAEADDDHEPRRARQGRPHRHRGSARGAIAPRARSTRPSSRAAGRKWPPRPSPMPRMPATVPVTDAAHGRVRRRRAIIAEPEPQAQPAAIASERIDGPARPPKRRAAADRHARRDRRRGAAGRAAGDPSMPKPPPRPPVEASADAGSRSVCRSGRRAAARSDGRDAGRRRRRSSSARRASAAAATRSASTRSRKSSSAGRSCWCRSSRKSAATRARRSPPTCRWPAATAC